MPTQDVHPSVSHVKTQPVPLEKATGEPESVDDKTQLAASYWINAERVIEPPELG